MAPTTLSRDTKDADGSVSTQVRGRAVTTLKLRSEYLRIRGGRKCGTSGFLLEGKRREGGEPAGAPRFGFTVTKKLGSAVIRNRIKRRLKAAAGELVGEAHADLDYVLVARKPAFDMPFQTLRDDLRRALTEVHRPGSRPATGRHRETS